MSQSDKEVDAVAEEINEAVNDGGGCAETWKALSDMRNVVPTVIAAVSSKDSVYRSV